MKKKDLLHAELLNVITGIDNIPSVRNILEVICTSTGMDIGIVAHVTKDRWIACSVRDDKGIDLKPGDELYINHTICSELYETNEPVFIANIDNCENMVWKEKMARKGFKSYISFPIFNSQGGFFGTLCTIDTKSIVIEEEKIFPLFRLFSELITFHLQSIEKVNAVEYLLKEEKRLSRRRDGFIAVLGHDLKNPLGAIISTSQFLYRHIDDPKHHRMIKIIQDSSLRMKGLIENILDFARGNLGSGIKLYKTNAQLEVTIEQVLSEIQAMWSQRTITQNISLNNYVHCDADRMAQAFSNLLGNALTHGHESKPIHLEAYIEANQFFFSVSNKGKKIPAKIMENLFKPFVRNKDNASRGLGLGLFITHQIILAHEGDVTVNSTDGNTTFTLKIPLEAIQE